MKRLLLAGIAMITFMAPATAIDDTVRLSVGIQLYAENCGFVEQRLQDVAQVFTRAQPNEARAVRAEFTRFINIYGRSAGYELLCETLGPEIEKFTKQTIKQKPQPARPSQCLDVDKNLNCKND
jgi:hypothetical protein